MDRGEGGRGKHACQRARPKEKATVGQAPKNKASCPDVGTTVTGTATKEAGRLTRSAAAAPRAGSRRVRARRARADGTNGRPEEGGQAVARRAGGRWRGERAGGGEESGRANPSRGRAAPRRSDDGPQHGGGREERPRGDRWDADGRVNGHRFRPGSGAKQKQGIPAHGCYNE